MAIVPTSQITICRNVPLSPSYVHTVDFPSRTLQGAYFATMAKYVERDYTYIRSTGRIRVQHPIGDLIDCNYLFYNNVNFENKTIYCFIVDLKYINNETTEIITLEDVFQTWWPDCKMTQCFVEREHVDSDTIGANLVDEGLELGDYVVEANVLLPEQYDLTKLGYIFVSPYICRINDSQEPWTVSIEKREAYGLDSRVKLLNGLELNYAPDLQHAWTMLTAFTESAEASNSVLAVIAVPSQIWNLATALQGKIWSDFDQFDKPYAHFMNGQYTPRNNKLYTYPYKFCRVRNDEGQEATYRYEWWSSQKVTFQYFALQQANFAIHAVPSNYRGINPEIESITLANWPQCGYSSDAYALWYAQNQVRFPASLASTVINAMGRYAMSAGLGAIMHPENPVAGAVGAIAPNVIEKGLSVVTNGIAPQAAPVQQKTTPDYTAAAQWASLVGGITDVQNTIVNNMAEDRAHQIGSMNGHYTGSDATMLMAGRKKISLEYMCITADMARRIDRYFDMFGYKVNMVKLPNVTGRHCWNYVKTNNCDVTGSVPQYATEAINTLFNTGITIWHNPSYIGNYDLDNYVDNG